MNEELAGMQEDLKQMRIRERIHRGVQTRLALEIPYIQYWPQAMALGAQPQNVVSTMTHLHKISDEVWF